MAIIMADAGDGCADGGRDAEFFRKLAGQRLLGAFASFNFSARKLPQRSHGLIDAALTDENLSAAYDEGRRYKAESGAVWPRSGVLLICSHVSSVIATKEVGYRIGECLLVRGEKIRYSPWTPFSSPSAAAGRK